LAAAELKTLHGAYSAIPSRGVFADHEAGVSGGVLAMIVHAGAAQTIAEAARLLEADGVIAAREKAAERRERDKRVEAAAEAKRRQAARLWASARPLAGTLGEIYLLFRAVATPLDGADLRFRADAPVYPYQPSCRDRHPALVARVSDAAGRGIGAHLTFLLHDGKGKANTNPARKAVGAVGGGFIRLAQGSRLVVGEGVESTLSAWEARPPDVVSFGAIAAISAGGMAGLIWPSNTEELIIAPDRDASGAGERAAQTIARRAWSAGLAVGFMRPPEAFGDWNDWARAERGRR
jgi:phage/plasmid primase-like uncharacterized protein